MHSIPGMSPEARWQASTHSMKINQDSEEAWSNGWRNEVRDSKAAGVHQASTREEKRCTEENMTLQRAALKHAAEQWSGTRGGISLRHRTSWRTGGNRPWCSTCLGVVPVSHRPDWRTMTQGTLQRVLAGAVPQRWGIISPGLNTAPVLPNTS